MLLFYPFPFRDGKKVKVLAKRNRESEDMLELKTNKTQKVVIFSLLQQLTLWGNIAFFRLEKVVE